jgi:NhaP-type Na+/H+ or K+/H+ antiporter
MVEYYYSKMRLVLDGVGIDLITREVAILVVGVLLGYALRAFISARRRSRARKSRHDFHQ